MMDFAQALTDARERAARDALRRAEDIRALDQETEGRIALARKVMFPALRPANRRLYEEWLRGYVALGGDITHVYDYPFSRWAWYQAVKDVKVVSLYGAQAVNIIIPRGVTCRGDAGHNSLFWLDTYAYVGIVPLFSDTGA